MKMPGKTERALNASIAHWRRFKKGKALPGERPYGKDCALCKLFATPFASCAGCPVYEKTSISYCGGTPWVRAHRAFDNYGVDSPQFLDSAAEELKFLISLRSVKTIPLGKQIRAILNCSPQRAGAIIRVARRVIGEDADEALITILKSVKSS